MCLCIRYILVSGSVATQLRLGGKFCVHLEAMIVRMYVPKIVKIGLSCCKL